ncbi:hypothetical protein F4781DRAFT_368545 [Annulohypoxylon bovei var. microspora]|nr:hypothetical protein F4781DRAFT_368545 [Annulohypoxylon bovei var. microspora]
MSLSKLKNFITQSWPPRPIFTENSIAAGSQAGRVFIVTGGNAGIGFELCNLLFKSGATIYMASRSKVVLLAAIKSITESNTSPSAGQLKFLPLDLSDLNSVQQAARTFAQQESKLDVLWNNAGTGANAAAYSDRTEQGFEALVGTHCIATLLFTELLLPQLKASATGNTESNTTRVIWLATALVDSAAPKYGIDFSILDKGAKDRITNYAMSKAGVWILGREFARRYGKDGILSLVANPGNVKAGSYAGTPKFFMLLLNATMLYEPVFGAYTELYAGLSPEINMDVNGIYIMPWGRLLPDHSAVRQDIIKSMTPEEEGGLGYGKKFWDWCETQWKPYTES